MSPQKDEPRVLGGGAGFTGYQRANSLDYAGRLRKPLQEGAMSDRLHMASDWCRLGPELSIRFTLSDNQLGPEWAPRLPTKKQFLAVIGEYRAARNEFLSAVGQRRGGVVLCLEVQL